MDELEKDREGRRRSIALVTGMLAVAGLSLLFHWLHFEVLAALAGAAAGVLLFVAAGHIVGSLGSHD